MEENTDDIVRLRNRVKEFLENFKPEDIEVKTKQMRENLIRASTQRGPEFYQEGQMMK